MNQILNLHQTKLEDVSNFIYYYLVRPIGIVYQKLIEARQAKANWEIARILQQTEYRSESLSTIYDAIQRNDIRSLDKV